MGVKVLELHQEKSMLETSRHENPVPDLYMSALQSWHVQLYPGRFCSCVQIYT